MGNGFLVTCVINREEKAFKEFKDVVDFLKFQYSENNQITTKTDFLKLMISDLKNLNIKSDYILKDKYKSVLWIENTSDINSKHVFDRLRENETKFKYILRIFPLDVMGKIDLLKLENYIKINRFFGTYKIIFEGRLCELNLKEKIYKTIIPLITNKVNLTNPDYLIVIQVLKNMMGFSIIRNDNKKFNFSY